MTAQTKRIYEFGPFRVDAGERVLLRDGRPEALPPKAFEVLLMLVERSGHIVGKDELMNRVWADSFVEEGNVKVTVSLLRKALQQSAGEHQFIETVPRRGYRFTADVRELTRSEPELILLDRARVQMVIEKDEEPIPVREPARARPLGELTGTTVHKRRLMIVAAALAIAAAGVGLAVYKLVGGKQFQARREEIFAKMKMARLTTNGGVHAAAISPDGKYVAHAIGGRNGDSLWLKHITTSSDTEVIPSAQAIYASVAFSPDGNYIYFVRYPEVRMYRVPVLGGSIQKLGDGDVDSAITFSPNGSQIAFIRGFPEKNEAALIIANADGTGERTLITKPVIDVFPDPTKSFGPAWSPHGEVIAFALKKEESGGKYWDVITVQANDHREQQITFQKWAELGHLAWLSDGSGLIVAAADEESYPAHQIWHISYSSGDVRRITNDTNDYDGVTVTADSTSLLTVQREQRANVWVAPGGDASRAAQITSDNAEGIDGITWTPDGRIVHTRRSRGSTNIWIMNADGSAQNQLTLDHASTAPSVSDDGRYVVFASDRSGKRCIWRIDIDGSSPKQLTHEIDAGIPDISPDGKWVVYTDIGLGTRTLWKVSINGGDPVQLIDSYSRTPLVSPDGKQIAFVFLDEDVTPKRLRNAIIPFDGGQPVKVFDLAPKGIRWASDGRALTYPVRRKGVSNIWAQPLDGSLPKQVTNFTTDAIFAHAWSADGKQLACARGHWNSDVVLIAADR